MLAQEVVDGLYALEMQDEKDVLNRVPDEARLNIIDPDVGKYLYLQALTLKAKNIVEIGTGGGYATLWLGVAAQLNGGKVSSYEVSATKAEAAQANIAKAGLSDYVDIINADARDALRGETSPVDFAFIDADSDQYETYFDVLYKRLQPGTLLISDRILSDESALEDFVSYMQNHPNLDSVTIPMANGLEYTVKIE